MDMKKKLRKSFTFALALMMMVVSIFTGIGTAGLTEVQAAGEPAGRGTDWDILYSEIRSNGNGKAYGAGTRIYMDVSAQREGNDANYFYIDSFEAAAYYDIISYSSIDTAYQYASMNNKYELNNIVTLEDTYDVTGLGIKIKSGGYWVFHLDDENCTGDTFYGVAASSEDSYYKNGKLSESEYEIVTEGTNTPGGSGSTSQTVTNLEVNIDWSKVPNLTVGTEIGEEAKNLPSVDGVFTVNSTQIGNDTICQWAVQATSQHVSEGYISDQRYEEYSDYNHLIPLSEFNKNYKISADDIYYCFVAVEPASGYEFGEDISSILTTNISDAIAYNEDGLAVIYPKLGTPEQIAEKNGSSTGGSVTPGQKITELEVNIDWSKVPGLTVGASAFPDVPESACQTTSSLVRTNGYGWAVKATENHVTKGYLKKDVYDEYAVYDHWIPVYMFDPSYVISADDVYYCYTSFETDTEHKFGDGDGVDVTSILKTNVSEKLALTDAGGKRVVVFLRLGTPAEILANNGGQIGGTGGTEPSKPTTPKYELTSEQVTTTDEIENAYVYEWNDLDVFDALMDAANDYLSKLEHSNDKGYLYVIPLNQYNGKKYMAWGFGSIKYDGVYITLDKINEHLQNGDNVYILKPYEPGSNTPGGEEPKNNTTTDVVVSADTPVGSVAGLEKIFETIAAEDNKGYTAADQAVVAAGGSAKIYLDAKLVTSETSGSKAATEELTKAGYQSAIALDLSVIKEIRTVAGVTTTTRLIELPALISVISDIPEAYQGKAEYCIYRNHEGTVDILTTTPNADGEYIELSADGKQLILHIKKFSEYVLGYKESTTSSTPSTPANSTTSTNQTAASTTQDTQTTAAQDAQTAATTATSPKTGEDTSMALFVMIFALAGLGMVVVYKKAKRA